MASPPGTRSASQQAAASSARSSSDYPPSAFLQGPFQVRGRVPASIGFPEQRVAQTHDAGHVFQSDRPDPHLGSVIARLFGLIRLRRRPYNGTFSLCNPSDHGERYRRQGRSAAAAMAGSPRDRKSQTLRCIAGAGRQTPAHPGREKCRHLATTRTAWPLLITTTMSPCPQISPQFSERRYYYFLTTVILLS
jgi:hypothetical protein